MLIDLLRPVTVQRAEEVSRRMREIETDPANGILPMPPDPAAFSGPVSPVPAMITKLAIKYPGFLNMPRGPYPLHAHRDDPRMGQNASAGANPSTVRYWQEAITASRQREELRRILQRHGWADSELKFLESRHSDAELIHTIRYHRRRLLAERRNFSHLEFETFEKLLNRDRAWISSLMNGMRFEALGIPIRQTKKPGQLDLELIRQDELRLISREVEKAGTDLAAYLAATAYHLTKKAG